MDFHLNDNEISTLAEWRKSHECPARVMMRYPYRSLNRMHSPIVQFIQTSCGIGTTTIARCQCGVEKDITDLDCW